MTGASFATLFAWEWRRVVATPLFWLIQGALVASMIWAVLVTASFHRGQDGAIARTLTADAAHRASVRQRFAAYRAPVTPAAPAVPYWQDPSDVAGFSQYFVAPPATKPHLPLSPLAVGSSDLAPTRMDVKLATPFGIDERYDFENPRGLALGRFDLAFVLALLLPLALILQHGLLVTFERDRGMLRLVAAQATTPRVWLAARGAAITAWAAPMTLTGLVLALAVAGVDLAAGVGELEAALLLVVAYMAFWTGVVLLVLSQLPGATAALGTLAAIWAILTLGVPLIANAVASTVAPAPSASEWIDAQRRVADSIQRDRDRIIAQAVAARPDLSRMADRIATLDHATRLTFLVPETERRLAVRYDARAAYSRNQAAWATVIGYGAPPLGLTQVLAALAGTDGARNRAFEAQVRAYQLGLRRSLYPLVQREAVDPTPHGASRGKYSLSDPDIIPAFAMTDATSHHRVAAVLPFVAWLVLAGLILGGLGLRRADRWVL